MISLVKCTPAAYWNYKRKSTKGWSIFNIILDLIGAVLSFASGTLSVDDGLNLTKVLLAVVSVGFDVLFVVQHYCLYRKKEEIMEDRNNLGDNLVDNNKIE
jgi:uncharacterized membrane protein YeaQ/YmgE (transglycosylase-associated protein family)